MADYIRQLRDDLLEQFKDKPVIGALIEAVGSQLNDVRQFFADLREMRGVQTAVGRQLDGVGDIVDFSRLEAGEMACIKESVYVLDDEAYRKLLIYKIWKNTNNCTYYDIIKALRMFWEKPLHYSENPEVPATMIFETDTLTPEDNVRKLLTAPLIKAAGVAIILIAYTENPEMIANLPVDGVLCHGYMSTVLPEIPVGEDFEDTVRPVPAMQNITQTKLPEMEEERT